MGRSIQEMYDKFKRYLSDDTFFYGMVIILIAITSFGLGRWSVTYEAEKPVISPNTSSQKASIIQENDQFKVKNASSSTIPISKTQSAVTGETQQFVGSKNSTKYHLTWCPGASQIKEENRIYFATKEEAEKAGYTPASNCKGM